MKINNKEYEVSNLTIALDGSMTFVLNTDINKFVKQFPATIENEGAMYFNVALNTIKPHGDDFEVACKCKVVNVVDANEIESRLKETEDAIVELAEIIGG